MSRRAAAGGAPVVKWLSRQPKKREWLSLATTPAGSGSAQQKSSTMENHRFPCPTCVLARQALIWCPMVVRQP